MRIYNHIRRVATALFSELSVWGALGGTLADQTDLQSALDGKSSTSHNHAGTYATAAHNHDATYAALSHTHTMSGITDLVRGAYIALVAGGASTTTDGQTMYWAGTGAPPQASSGTQCIYIPYACTIKAAYIWAHSGTVGSNEAWPVSLRKNDTTDTAVATVGAATAVRVWSNTSLNISIAQGDKIEVKAKNPSWGTNPANVRFGGMLYVEFS